MLQAFKSNDRKLTPFTSVIQAWKDGDFYITLLVTGREKAESYFFKSEEDRDQQFVNFETWLTAKTNSI